MDNGIGIKAVRIAIAICLSGLFMLPAAAQPVPQIKAAAPVSLQRGKSLEVTLAGGALAQVDAVALPDARGLEAVLVKPEKPENDKIRLKLTAAPDAAPGARELRLIGPAGVSNPLRVYVDQFPDVTEREPNGSPGEAQAVELPAVLVGRIDSAGDGDRFRFDAKRGQTLVIEVQAGRAGSPLDATVTLFDASGREVRANNDHNGADPFIAYDVPEDGSYALEIRDLQYRGGGDYAYRVIAGPVPYVESLVPMSSRRGGPVEVKAVGYNLDPDPIRLDLTYAPAGRISLRTRGPAGISNELPFEVTELPPVVEREPNDKPDEATAVAVPAEVSGIIAQADDEDLFRFKLEQKQFVRLEVVARRLGSPLDALLTLKNAKGETVEMNDDAAMADAAVARELEPGEYVVSVRDLTYNGGPDFAYRLKVEPSMGGSPGGAGQDFLVRLQPDNPRVHRGGHAKLWCEVVRVNGYDGPVTVALENLPAGVNFTPMVFTRAASGTFTVSAAPEARLGSYPVRLRASGVVNGQLVSREADVEMPSGQDVRQAYLTVLEPAPFTIEPAASLNDGQRQQLAEEAKKLQEKLANAANLPELAKAQAEWEKKVAGTTEWVTLDPESAATVNRVQVAKQPDGSLLTVSRGDNLVPQIDTYTVVAKTNLKGITAVRLEALTDPSLPNRGPGRSDGGNFVINQFKVVAAPASDPGKGQPVPLKDAKATFEQGGYGVKGAIDDNPATGWAIFPKVGQPQTAVFFTKSPITQEGEDLLLTITMDQTYGQQHVLGRFRLSITTDPDPKLADSLPGPILAIVKTPAEKRTDEQKKQIAEYYRSISPEIAADRARMQGLRAAVGTYGEIERLEKVLNTQTPQLDAEMKEWEQLVLGGAKWTPVEFSEMKSNGGARLEREADDSVSVSGNNPEHDTYTLTGPAPVRGLTAIRLEALSDPKLPQDGPGRADNGNFVVSRVRVFAAPKADPSKRQPVALHAAEASFEQPGWPASGVLDDRPDTGWAVLPHLGRPNTATFHTRAALGGGDDTLLTVEIEHASNNPKHALGRFRVCVTNALEPRAVASVPPDVMRLLRNPNRDAGARAELSAYYRSFAPSLEPVRQRLAELRSLADAFPPAVARNRGGSVPLLIRRRGDFKGPVTITIEGYTPGREGNGPANNRRDLTFNPLTVGENDVFATMNFTVNGNVQPETRLAVLKAEAKVGDYTVVQYSPAFPLTVK